MHKPSYNRLCRRVPQCCCKHSLARPCRSSQPGTRRAPPQEENFKDLDLTRTVHLGWGALGGEYSSRM